MASLFKTSVLFSLQFVEDLLPTGVRSVLVIKDTQDGIDGVYNCSITNAYGTDTIAIQLVARSEYSVYTCFQICYDNFDEFFRKCFPFYFRNIPDAHYYDGGDWRSYSDSSPNDGSHTMST